MQTESITIETINVDKRLRQVDSKAVQSLASSIKEIGLLQPITLHTPDDGKTLNLVAGAHRLEAVKSLGWPDIDAFIMEGDFLDCQRAEIAENLHRADLTAAERSEQISLWVQLTEEKQERDKLRQVDAVSDEGNKGGRGKESGTRAAARELGINEPAARRAKKIASMTPEAKKAAKDAGLDNNQSALEKIAKADDQVAEVERIAKEKKEKADQKKREKEEDEAARAERQKKKEFDALVTAWTKARPSVRDQFRAHIESV